MEKKCLKFFEEIIKIKEDQKSSSFDEKKIKKIFEYICEVCHKQYKKKQGKLDIHKPIYATKIIANVYFDNELIAASLLYLFVFYEYISIDDVKKQFGHKIGKIVDNVVKILKIEWTHEHEYDIHQNETIKKMLVSFSKDIRVILLVLADRIQTLIYNQFLSSDEVLMVAKDALYIHSHIADKLGIWKFKSQLEDLSFKYLYKKEYESFEKDYSISLMGADVYIQDFEKILKNILLKNNFEYIKIQKRIKSLYSTYKKMILKQKALEDIQDIFAVRIITKTESDCYMLLGIIHSYFKPFSHRIKDYIADPKINGYKSIHTTVRGIDGRPTEIQICTEDMYNHSQFGIAAHFVYSDKKHAITPKAKDKEWLKYTKTLQKNIRNLESHEMDVFSNYIFVSTPNGDIRELPKHSTIIDFAYNIHSQVGNSCMGAKINGKIKPIFTELQNGNKIEILTGKNASGPTMQWLDFVVTSKAKSKIRKHLKKSNSQKLITNGEKLFLNALNKLNKKMKKSYKEKLINLLPYKTFESLLIAIGEGSLSVNHVIKKLFSDREIFGNKPKEKLKVKKQQISKPMIIIADHENTECSIAKCCSPKPGDSIISYMTLKNGMTIHSTHCSELKYFNTGRLFSAWWKESKPDKITHNIKIEIKTYDNQNVFQKIINMLSADEFIIKELKTTPQDDIYLIITIGLDVTQYEDLTKIFSILEKISGVISMKKVL